MSIERPSVLVVDDEPHVVLVIRMALEIAGYPVYTAGDGVEGLAQIRLHAPQVVVLDVVMPRMDGWAVLEELATVPEHERPRVVMLTALASPADRARAIEGGAGAFLPKPFDVDELLRTIEGLALAA